MLPPDLIYVAMWQGTSTWPAISVVMPVKGCRTHSSHNWSTQVGINYGGPVEFLFVLESSEDDAYMPLTQLSEDLNKGPDPGKQARGGLATAGGMSGGSTGSSEVQGEDFKETRSARIVISGQSTSCSQKIHNLLAGADAASASSAYTLFLDDDVDLHPSAVEDLVDTLERDPTQFVWGGCILLRAGQLRNGDKYGVLKSRYVRVGSWDPKNIPVAGRCILSGRRAPTTKSSIKPYAPQRARRMCGVVGLVMGHTSPVAAVCIVPGQHCGPNDHPP
eukprot:gene6107-2709_t